MLPLLRLECSFHHGIGCIGRYFLCDVAFPTFSIYLLLSLQYIVSAFIGSRLVDWCVCVRVCFCMCESWNFYQLLSSITVNVFFHTFRIQRSIWQFICFGGRKGVNSIFTGVCAWESVHVCVCVFADIFVINFLDWSLFLSVLWFICNDNLIYCMIKITKCASAHLQGEPIPIVILLTRRHSHAQA